MTRVTQDVGELQDFLVQGITFFLVNTLIIVGILVALLVYNWKLTLLVLIPVPLTVIATRRDLAAAADALAAPVAPAGQPVGQHQRRHFRRPRRQGVRPGSRGRRPRFRAKSHDLFEANVVVQQAWNTYFPVLSFLTTAGRFHHLVLRRPGSVRQLAPTRRTA